MIAFLVLSSLYFLKIYQTGLLSFDANFNAQVIRQITYQQYENLFNHASPLFFILFVPLYWLSANYELLQFVNALIFVLAIVVWANWLAHQWNFSKTLHFLLVLLIGISPLALHNAVGFSIEACFLLCAGLLLRYYYRSWYENTNKNLDKVALVAGIGLTINYKLLLFIGVLLLIELFQTHQKRSVRQIARMTCLAAVPFITLSLLGFFLGLSPILYAAIWYHILLVRVPNMAGFTGSLGQDMLFYVRYFWCFENIILLIISLLAIFSVVSQLLKKTITELLKPNFETLLVFVVLLYFIVITLLPKAPRGLLPIWPIIVGLGVWYGQKYWPTRAVWQYLAVFFLTAWSLYLSYQYVLKYSETNYASVAKIIKEKPNNQVFGTTVGINIFQYLPEKSILFAFDTSKAQTFDLLLMDDYSHIANIPFSDKFLAKNYILLGQWKERSLLSPILWLEHCEYTGRSFEKTLQLRDSSETKAAQLKLYIKNKY